MHANRMRNKASRAFQKASIKNDKIIFTTRQIKRREFCIQTNEICGGDFTYCGLTVFMATP